MGPSLSVRLLATQSDARLAELAAQGHERAFEALVLRYRRALLGYCRRLPLSGGLAEDALQQGLLQAWLALRSGTEVRDPKPWLYRVVRNAALNMRRSAAPDHGELSETLGGSDAPEVDVDRQLAVRDMLAGLVALPENQREALLRTAVEGHSHEQVAATLGLSDGAVRGLVYRARATLRAGVTAITPPPLLNWALSCGPRGGPAMAGVIEISAGGGSVGLGGLLLKGSVIAATAGALVTTVGISHHHHPVVASHARRVSPKAAAHQVATSTASPTLSVTSLVADGPSPEVNIVSRAPGDGRAALRTRADAVLVAHRTSARRGRSNRSGESAAGDGSDEHSGRAPRTVGGGDGNTSGSPKSSDGGDSGGTPNRSDGGGSGGTPSSDGGGSNSGRSDGGGSNTTPKRSGDGGSSGGTSDGGGSSHTPTTPSGIASEASGSSGTSRSTGSSDGGGAGPSPSGGGDGSGGSSGSSDGGHGNDGSPTTPAPSTTPTTGSTPTTLGSGDGGGGGTSPAPNSTSGDHGGN